MQSDTQIAPVSNVTLWAGRALSALPVLMLLYSGVMKVVRPELITGGDEWKKLGWAEDSLLILGILELGSTVIYVIPRTSILGAILLTGYFGGAIATHLRVGDASFIFPVVLGVLVWGGLYLRDTGLRAFLPLRSEVGSPSQNQAK
jgi:hypothetical protein